MSAGGHGSAGTDLSNRGQHWRNQQHQQQQQQQQDMRRHIRIVASRSHPDAISQPSHANSTMADPIRGVPTSSIHPTNRIIDFDRISDEEIYGAREREAQLEKEREREWDRKWEREWEREQGREYEREHDHQEQERQQQQQQQHTDYIEQRRELEREREHEAQALNNQQQHRYQSQQQQRQQQQQQRQEQQRIKREKKEEAKYTDTESTPAWLESWSERLSIAEPPKKQAREQRKSILQTFFPKNPEKISLLTHWVTHNEGELGRQPKVVDLWQPQREHEIQHIVTADSTSAQREQGVFISTASRPTPVKSPHSHKGQGMHSSNTHSFYDTLYTQITEYLYSRLKMKISHRSFFLS
jgi:hypothetical protein